MNKLYAYVDETGLHTEGKTFLVGIVIVGNEREQLIQDLEAIERTSGKGNVKWIESKSTARLAYIKAVLAHKGFAGSLYYKTYPNPQNYQVLTATATGDAVLKHAEGEYKVTIFVDALEDVYIRQYGAILRKMQVRTKKVRGIRKEQTDALIRLADALCGLAREAQEGKRDPQNILDRAIRDGYVTCL